MVTIIEAERLRTAFIDLSLHSIRALLLGVTTFESRTLSIKPSEILLRVLLSVVDLYSIKTLE